MSDDFSDLNEYRPSLKPRNRVRETIIGASISAVAIAGAIIYNAVSSNGSHHHQFAAASTGSTTAAVIPAPLSGAATAVPSPSPSAADGFQPKVTYTFNGTSGDGSTATVSLAIGSVQHTPIADGCVQNAQTDAVIPFQITTTNTTTGFNLDTSVAVVIGDWGQGNASGLDAQIFLWGETIDGGCADPDNPPNDGASLTDPQGAVAYTPGTNLAPNETSTETGQFVLQNYYTPNTPNGSPAVLHDYPLTLELGDNTPYEIMKYTASGQGIDNDPDNGILFTLDGSSAQTALTNWTSGTTVQLPP